MMAKSSNERFQNWYLTGFAVIGSFAACSVVPESAQLKLTDDSPKKLLLADFSIFWADWKYFCEPCLKAYVLNIVWGL